MKVLLPVLSSLSFNSNPNSRAIIESLPNEHYGRLLEALAVELHEKRYADITIADIVTTARVSKRTFYEQFTSKEDCLIALSYFVSDELLKLIAAHFNSQLPWQSQLQMILRLYLTHLQAHPAIMRALFIELITTSPKGLAVRRQILQRFAEFLIFQVEVIRQTHPAKHALNPIVAMAIVGGINELVLQVMERDQIDCLVDHVMQPAIEFIYAVFSYLERDLKEF